MKHFQGNMHVSVRRLSQVQLMWENCPKTVKWVRVLPSIGVWTRMWVFRDQCECWAIKPLAIGWTLSNLQIQLLNYFTERIFDPGFPHLVWISSSFSYSGFCLNFLLLRKVLFYFCATKEDYYTLYFWRGRQENCFPFNFSFLILNDSMQNKNMLEITHALAIPKNIA